MMMMVMMTKITNMITAMKLLMVDPKDLRLLIPLVAHGFLKGFTSQESSLFGSAHAPD